MKKILGLDLGTASIGWALVNEAETSEERSSIIKLGVRVNPLTSDETRDFEKGKSITTNAKRTKKRSMRRNLQRYKLRRGALVAILKENGFIGENTILSENGNRTTFETYRLRAKAASEEVSLEEFARVLLMLNKKRGYKSNRKADSSKKKNDSADEGKLIDGMSVAELLHKDNLTPGEYVLQRLNNGEKTIPEFYKSDLQDELDRIWACQKHFYPDKLTNELKESLQGKKNTETDVICREKFDIEGVNRNTKGESKTKENYLWRSKALKECLGLEELTVVLQEVNSQLTASNTDLGRISNRSKELYFNNQTVGQYLMAQLDADPNCSLKNQVFYRQDYLDEFEKLWETQAKYHEELTSELKKKIESEIIFYQRPLKSKKGLISICELESKEIEVENNGKKRTIRVGSRVCPKSSPLFQEFKIWQTINNLQVEGNVIKSSQTDLFGETSGYVYGKRFLEKEEKDTLFNELNFCEELSDKAIVKLLFGNKAEVSLNYKSVQGNLTNATLIKVYENIMEIATSGKNNISKLGATKKVEELEKFFRQSGYGTGLLHFDATLSGDAFEKQPSYMLWHLIYSFEGDNSKTGNEKLIAKISKLYGFEKEYASMLANIVFKPDYGSLSTKAMRKIVPHLKEGLTYSDACERAGYNHSKRSLTREEIDAKPLKDSLELLPRNSLRNPVVEKILNQMINVVNSLVETYGKPDEIRIELARDLKKSAKERQEATERINASKKEHEEIVKKLEEEFHIPNPTRNDIIRYKLYKELADVNNYRTFYTNTYIPQEELFSKKFNVEHIIPQAKRFDDSFSNKTLELRDANQEKDKKTAYDYVKDKYGEEKAIEYKERLKAKYKEGRSRVMTNSLEKKMVLSEAKYKNLTTTASEIETGFIERDLRDSQYIAKKAREILESLVKVVSTTTGSVTDRLREDWQLVNVMKELNLPKYKSRGLVEWQTNRDGQRIERITDWTKRNDHRHHAMDALTIAFTKPSYIQYLNNLNARVQKSEGDIIDLDTVEISLLSKEDRAKAVYGIEKKELYRDANGKLKFIPPMPLDELRSEAKKQLENVLVSIKAKNKVVTKNVNTTKKAGENHKTVQLTPRDQLHNETLYRQIKRYKQEKEKVGRGFDQEKIQTVACERYREALLRRLAEFGGDPKKAFTGKNSLEKNPVWIDEHHSENVPQKVTTFETLYTVRKPINKDLNINDKAKDRQKTIVVDSKVKKILQDRLKEFGGDKSKAFSNLDTNPIWLNKEKGISIKRVSIGEKLGNTFALHSKRDKDGNFILSEGEKLATDFVKPDDNHHIAIYRRPLIDKDTNMPRTDEDGNVQYELMESVVTFFEAAIRANNGDPIIDRTYKQNEGWQFLFSLKINEYFVFPRYEPVNENGEEKQMKTFDPEKVDLLNSDNYSLISPNLFRVQKLSSKYYEFRHHLETTVDDSNKELKDVTWKRCTSFDSVKGIVKVRINHIGQIVSVGEY